MAAVDEDIILESDEDTSHNYQMQDGWISLSNISAIFCSKSWTSMLYSTLWVDTNSSDSYLISTSIIPTTLVSSAKT